MAYTKKRNEKDGTLYISVEDEKAGIPVVCLVDDTGAPYAASGGGGGGGTFDGQLTQGGTDVSITNPLPTKDVLLSDAIVNNGTDVTGGAQMMMAGGVSHLGTSAFIPVGLDGVPAQLSIIPIGGVDEAGNQKELEFLGEYAKTTNESIATDTGAKASKVTVIGGHNGSNSYGWHVNANGQGKVINDSLGDPTDAVATTDTGTWSIPALLKKLNQSITSLLGRFGTLGQKAMSGSTPVVIASDQSKISVQTDERPSASAGNITPSDTVGFGGTSRGIYVGVGGDISAVVNGLTIVFKNAVAGTIIPIQATRVNATATTATNLIVLF